MLQSIVKYLPVAGLTGTTVEILRALRAHDPELAFVEGSNKAIARRLREMAHGLGVAGISLTERKVKGSAVWRLAWKPGHAPAF